MIDTYLPIVMLGTLCAVLLIGYPVAFTIAGVALLFSAIGIELDLMSPLLIKALPRRIYGILQNYSLLAVPLFIFMGVTLEKAKLAERLLSSMSLLFNKQKAGMAFSVVIAGALLAAATGIVGASVVTMGLISLPVLLKRGYSKEFSCGLICASGTLGQIIPPSIVLVILGDVAGVAIGDLFLAALFPGLTLVVCYLAYSFFHCRGQKYQLEVPASISSSALVKEITYGLLPTMTLILLVLGSIFAGIASPTEAAAVGAFGALVLALLNRQLSFHNIKEISQKSMSLTTMVFFILIGATAFSLVFRGLGGDEIVRDLVSNLPYGKYFFLLLVMLLIFLLGCFLDFIEIVFVIVPIVMPLVLDFGFNPLWFSILIAVNIQMSFLTPPLGFSLFYLKGIAPAEIKTSEIYRGVIPFLFIQALVLLLLVVFPDIVTFLPELL